jgi:hypothetical protein
MEVRDEMDASLDRCIRRWVRPLNLADSEGNVRQLMDDEIWRTTEPERKRNSSGVTTRLLAPHSACLESARFAWLGTC